MMRKVAAPILCALLIVSPVNAFEGTTADIRPVEPTATMPLVLLAPPIAASEQVYEQAARDLTSYPDMIRWRLVRIQTDIVRKIFGAHVRQPENTGQLVGGHQTYFHEPAEGDPKRHLQLNFFDDASYKGLIGTTTVVQTNGETHYHIGTHLSEHDKALGAIDINLVNDLRGDWRISLTYRDNDGLVNFYSLRRVKGTPYYLVIERDRGRRNYGEITSPEVGVRDGGPLILADKFTGMYAEIGPTIDYGLADFSFGDAGVGYALGTFSGRPATAFKTENGGESWQPLRIERQWVPREIYFRNRDEGFLSLQFKPADAGVEGVHGCALLKTDNGGRNWKRLEQNGNDLCIFKIHFDRQGIGFGYGKLSANCQWQVLQSVDGGLSWRSYYTLPDNLRGVSRIETTGDKVVVHSQSGIVWQHEPVVVLDRNGHLVQEVATGYPSVKRIEFVSEEVIFANVRDELGEYLIRSTDGGLTWRRIFEGDFELLYAISEHEVAILLHKGPDSRTDTASSVTAIAFTSNGGQSWREGKKIRGLDLSVTQASQELDDGSKLVLGGDYILKLVPVTN